MAKWYFSCIDNGSKRQCFTVAASSKPDAIKKGMDRAKKHAAGDITTFNCSLKSC